MIGDKIGEGIKELEIRETYASENLPPAFAEAASRRQVTLSFDKLRMVRKSNHLLKRGNPSLFRGGRENY
ncbi:MAG TPA: hypothetical protein VMV04_14825 [Thermodesulfobacteriota bacterium]|nr:hypothetical protein [Thermodesulfobacteriota bacterium]